MPMRLIFLLVIIILGSIASEDLLKVLTPIAPIVAVLIIGAIIAERFMRRF